MRTALCITLLAFIACANAQLDYTPLTFKDKHDTNSTADEKTYSAVTLEVLRGFASGFLDAEIEDIGICGTKAIDIGHRFAKIFTDLFSGKFNSYIKAMNDVIAIAGMVPREIKACGTFKDALEKVITRYHMTLNIKQFFQNMFFNLIFHLFDITSSLAYAVEGAMDAGYFEAGKQAGKALQLFLFNESNESVLI